MGKIRKDKSSNVLFIEYLLNIYNLDETPVDIAVELNDIKCYSVFYCASKGIQHVIVSSCFVLTVHPINP